MGCTGRLWNRTNQGLNAGSATPWLCDHEQVTLCPTCKLWVTRLACHRTAVKSKEHVDLAQHLTQSHVEFV